MSSPPESDTELTLALPGDCRISPENKSKTSGNKRGFLETVDLSLGSQNKDGKNSPENEISSAVKPPPQKAQVVGWPPVRGGGIKKESTERCKYVKVAVDGAPYLRKVDLEMYSSYEQLLSALKKLFRFGVEYVHTFQDKDGDWMMLGDVPWKMFVESCIRIRLMKSADANGSGGVFGRTCSTCSS